MYFKNCILLQTIAFIILLQIACRMTNLLFKLELGGHTIKKVITSNILLCKALMNTAIKFSFAETKTNCFTVFIKWPLKYLTLKLGKTFYALRLLTRLERKLLVEKSNFECVNLVFNEFLLCGTKRINRNYLTVFCSEYLIRVFVLESEIQSHWSSSRAMWMTHHKCKQMRSIH